MNIYRFPFEKLDVWQEARQLVRHTYEAVKSFPSEEKFGLTSQITRAAVSVASNIAEGSSRASSKDQAHFSQLAYGSLMELNCQFILAKDLGFISEMEYVKNREEILKIANKLSALRQYQLSKTKK
jgi:four helix bundle protein